VNRTVPSSDGGPVVHTRGLTKRFGDTVALADLDLEVPAGCIFGYLGPNGAGKSTTIRLLLGLLRPTSGEANVLGHDVVSDRRSVHRLVGYLPGDVSIDPGLTGRQYLDYLANLRGGCDPAVRDELADRLNLDLRRKVGALSHGNRQKVGIVQAFMHEPSLLVLDEPTQGLDPLVQRTFLDLLRSTRDRGATVFLSSHVLSEVEEVADLVAILRDGRLVATTSVAELAQRTRRRIELTFATPPDLDALTAVPGVSDVRTTDGAVEVVVEGSMAELFRTTAPWGIDRVVADEVDLTDVFLHLYEHA
jgi:ABC-2 type transport system ATP-binding protein